ncbi:uncharacterized protein CcaverHIS019_0208120 [Cutaneotrichosporon cavernicola]|uniref:Uncharacterized protein n=1 Tax=Cutaneotrichosporon cavernicola TaxID=279322 RepID=A0AA48L1D5_9TREE|nr:uncharacterized protein CcaverHIS019_0208120 [Cutaneotrichosporon cavernicola]BEI89450.1 hypothetical protein CcaverHIS019_0208120 [Cutaneotrichosporon cavernicola]
MRSSPRPTTPSSRDRGSPRASTTNVNVTTLVRPSHSRTGSAGHLPPLSGRPPPPVHAPPPQAQAGSVRGGRPPALDTDASRSWPATAAGPLLSPPPLEAEAFDVERAARRLRATEGRVNFDEIVPPPQEERPRLGGRRWSLW